jgi:CHAT domain-containing protein
MSRHLKRRGVVLCAVVIFLPFSALGQLQNPDSASSPSLDSTPNNRVQVAAPATTNKDSTAGNTAQNTPPDIAVQVDELIQQSNEAMNVKVQFQRSEELARQALELSEKARDKGRAAMAMVYLESAIAYQGRLSEALEIAQKNVPVARESGNKKVLEQALNSLASITGGLGRYEEALGYFYECLGLAREIKDPTMQYMSLLNIGEAYVRSDDPDKAELPLQQSLRIARYLKPNLRASNPSKKATEMALLNLGGMEMARRHYRAALKYYEKVHESKPESSLWVVAALQGIAASYEQLDEPQKAIESLDQAIPIAEKAASGVEYRSLLSALGVNQEKLGNLEAALASENKALTLIHEAGGDPDSQWQVESRIAHVERRLGRNDEALDHYRKSIRGIEFLRSVALNTEEGKAGVLGKSQATYAETVDLLFELHRPEEALEIAERGRARAFLDMLTEARVGVADEMKPDQRHQEDAILSQISSVQKELWKQDISSGEKKKQEAQLTSAEADLEEFHLQVRRSNPHYAGVRYPEPVSVGDIQTRLLDDHTALVEYLLGNQRSLAWVITKDKVTTSVLPARKDIEEQVAAYRKLLSQRVSALTVHQSLAEITSIGSKLYKAIFGPLEDDLRFAQTLIIVPDGTLSYLPFEALVTGPSQGRPVFLAEKFAVVYGPSASALISVQSIDRQVAWQKQLLAFGAPSIRSVRTQQASLNSPTDTISKIRNASRADNYAQRGFSLVPLPYAREEVLAIGGLFPASQRRVYIGPEAREEAVKIEKLEDFRFIHFASHGFLNETKPGRSGILFSYVPDSSEDGILQVGEIMRLKLRAELVTLSACSTGLGKMVNGEGILGLTRAFFYAGARNVAVSLWNVNDSGTAFLMESFYQNLNRGFPKSEAMRQAKLSLLRGSQSLWRHPYFWAAFIVEGPGR